MRDAARNGETAAFYQSDIQFHQSMWRLPGNEFLERALVPLSIGPVTFFLAGSPLLPPNQRDLLRVVAEHEEILEALRKGPGRACRKVIVSKIKTWRDQQRKYVLSASSK
jgi:DNA-binding GntR family transcriptional regulator